MTATARKSSPRLVLAPIGVPAPRVKRQPKPRNVAAVVTVAVFMGTVRAFVPLATWWLTHHELDWSAPTSGSALYLALGGLLFSSRSVYAWGKHAFQGDALKAFGFVFMLEGILSLVRAEWLSLSALVILMAVNAISTKGLARAR